MSSKLEAGFDDAMMNIYRRAKQEVSYDARRYFQMLLDHRGLETARRLVLASEPSEGYTRLWEKGRLDLTVEALVIDSQWESLFSSEPELIEKARLRLAEYGYVFTR